MRILRVAGSKPIERASLPRTATPGPYSVAMSNWGRLGVFDLETTGVNVDTSRIVSACIAVLDPDGTVVARWDWLANPGVEIPEGAAAVHGITTERARAEGRPAEAVIAEITQSLRMLFALGMPVVVYNAPYDLSLLDRECRRYGLAPIEHHCPVIDPLVMDKKVDRFRKGKRTLGVTADRYGVSLDDAHDAGADAIAAGRVAQSLVRAYPEELDVPVGDLHDRQVAWYAEQAGSFQDYKRRTIGDDTFVADTAWPVRPSASPGTFVDTQPIPRPEPRPSLTVPPFDVYGSGTLSLESLRTAPVNAYATAPPPAYHDPAATPDAIIEPDIEIAMPMAATLPDTAETLPTSRPTVLRVAAAIISNADGHTLVVRKRGTSQFMQAGGKIEAGESALEALSRELREEVGIEIDLDTTEYIGSYRAVAANEPSTIIRAEVFALTVSGPVDACGEIEEVVWLDSLDSADIELAPLTRDTILPIWVQRRATLF